MASGNSTAYVRDRHFGRAIRVCDMKVRIRQVSFFEPLNRAYMIRSANGGALWPNRSAIWSSNGPQSCGRFRIWKIFAPGRSLEPVVAVVIRVAIVIGQATPVTGRTRD